MKTAFAFRYSDMRLGGIQNILYNHVKFCLQREIKVFWIQSHTTDIHPGFGDIINPKTITICRADQAAEEINSFVEQQESRVILYSFGLRDFLYMHRLENQLKASDRRNYLIISNYQGPNIYLEENVHGSKKQQAFNAMKAFYQSLAESGQLIFCVPKQADAMQQHYGFQIPDIRRLALTVQPKYELKEELIRQRFRAKNILTVSRFDFPHKAYVLGLIDAFSKIGKMVPESKLTLIGYGSGEPEVRKRINMLEKSIKDRVTVIGGVAPDELVSYFDNTTVFVGLAGALGKAAAHGVVSIVARHFCEECEVYGFYSDHPAKSVSDEPGNEVTKYLQQVFSMTEEEYTCESEKTQKVYMEGMNNRATDFTNDFPIINHPVTLTNEQISMLAGLADAYSKAAKRRRFKNFLKAPGYNIKRLFNRYKKRGGK